MSEFERRWFALNVANSPAGGSTVGVIAKRTYRITGNIAAVADEQLPLIEEAVTTEDGVVLLHDLDIALNRREVDVVVKGHARVASPRNGFDVRLRVGALDRQIRVWGSRRCAIDSYGHARFSDATPVESVELSWMNAYGGVDRVAAASRVDPIQQHCESARLPFRAEFGSFAYPRNRVGKGYLIEATPAALQDFELPNLEEPAQLLTPDQLALGSSDRWPLAPAAAGVGFLNYSDFPRCAMLALVPHFDSKTILPTDFFEVRMRVLNPKSIAEWMPIQERLDIACAQQSAVGMRMSHIDPGSPVELTHVHPRTARWAFPLPSEWPSLFLQLHDGTVSELEPKIRTLIFEPELDRLAVVWVGEHHELTAVGPGKFAQLRCAVRWNGRP